MAIGKVLTVEVNGLTLRLGEMTIPLRNIAYWEKAEVRRGNGVRKMLLLTFAVLVVAIGANVATDGGAVGALVAALLFLGIAYVLWILYLRLRKPLFDLVLQTNAGDVPVLLRTTEESRLNELSKAISDRLNSDNALPPFTININKGQVINNSSFNNSDVNQYNRRR